MSRITCLRPPSPRIATGLAACLAAALLGACSEPARHPALERAALPALHGAHRFAAPGQLPGSYTVSPDGNRIAWTGTFLMRRTLFVRDLRTDTTRRYRARGSVQWTADSRRLVYVADTSGTENARVFAIDTESDAEALDLTPYPGVRAGLHLLPENDPRHALITHNRRNPALFDLYRVDLETGAETLVAANPGNAVAPLTQPDGALRGWQLSREAQRAPAERERAQAARAAEVRAREEPSVRVLGPSSAPRVVWALSGRGRDRTALVTLHAGPGWERVVAEDAHADITQAVISRVTREPLLIAAHPGYPRVDLPDPGLRAALAPVRAGFAGAPHGIELLASDRAERRMVVLAYTSTQHETWLIDRGAASAQRLARGVPDDLASSLAPMRAHRIPARDGLSLPAYLTLPPGVAARGLPMVLMVHGGPWARSVWADPLRADESARVQFLVNRGYAVLQVDFRGSTGYGRAFQLAAVGEFGRRMQDDLADAARWAVREGVADPRRIAVMGHSYGGFAALNALRLDPDLFACAVSLAGPTDLASLIESFPPYWTVDLSNWHDYVGNPRVAADRADMTARSPLTHAAAIRAPVLLIHGERDVRVRIDQSERMAAALQRGGTPVRLVRIAGMGHNPSWWAHHYRVLRETEGFLAGCLGGRAARVHWADPLVWAWTRLSG